MKIKKYGQEDYSKLCGWWNKRGILPIPSEFLPEIGFIVNDICAGFMYKTDAKIALIESLISDPESDKNLRSESLDLLLQSLVEESKKLGFKVNFVSIELPILIERYKKQGFVLVDKTFHNMIRLEL